MLKKLILTTAIVTACTAPTWAQEVTVGARNPNAINNSGNLAALEALINALGKKIDDLETKIDDVDTDLKSEINTVKTQITNINTRVTNIENNSSSSINTPAPAPTPTPAPQPVEKTYTATESETDADGANARATANCGSGETFVRGVALCTKGKLTSSRKSGNGWTGTCFASREAAVYVSVTCK